MYVKRRKYIVFSSHSRNMPFAPFRIIVPPSYIFSCKTPVTLDTCSDLGADPGVEVGVEVGARLGFV